MDPTVPDDDAEEERSNAAGKAGGLLVLGLVGAFFVSGWLEGDTPGETLWNTAYAGVGGLLGLLFAFKDLRERQLMQNTATSKVRSLAVGAVEVQGRARPVEEPLVSPLTQAEACVYQLEVQRKWESDDGSYWETVLEIDERPSFHVDDGTDQVLVDAEDAELAVEEENRVQVDSGEQPPAELAAWADQRDLAALDDEPEEGLLDTVTDIGEAIGDAVVSVVKGSPEEHLTDDSLFERRYIERVLGADETAYVLGGAYPRDGVPDPDNADNLVIREHEGTGEFIVSDRHEEALADEKLTRIALGLAIATALVPAAIFRGLLALAGS